MKKEIASKGLLRGIDQCLVININDSETEGRVYVLVIKVTPTT